MHNYDDANSIIVVAVVVNRENTEMIKCQGESYNQTVTQITSSVINNAVHFGIAIKYNYFFHKPILIEKHNDKKSCSSITNIFHIHILSSCVILSQVIL